MAVKIYYHDIDLDNNRLLNARMHPLTTLERNDLGLQLTDGDAGRLIYDSDQKSLFYWNGIQWAEVVSDKTFTHIQNIPSDTWTVNHQLEKFPSVSITDSANDEVIGEVNYVDINTVVIEFSAPFSGKAFFN